MFVELTRSMYPGGTVLVNLGRVEYMTNSPSGGTEITFSTDAQGYDQSITVDEDLITIYSKTKDKK